MCFRWTQWKKSMHLHLFITLSTLLINHVELAHVKKYTSEDDILRYKISSTAIEFDVADKNFTLLEVKCKDLRYNSEALRAAHNFSCENLKPCIDYLAVVKARDNNNEVSTRTLSIRTNYEVPEVTFAMVLPNNDSIFVSWNVTNSGCVSKFNVVTIFKKIAIKDVLLNSSNTHYEIGGLLPCEKYDVMLKVFDINDGLVGNISTEMETSFSDPGIIQSINFSENADHSIKVRWKPPKHKTCVEYYYLKWTKMDCLLSAPEKCTWTYQNYSHPNEYELNIDKLDGCAVYALVITPNGDYMDDPPHVNFTSPHQSSDTELDLKIVKENSTQVKISWKPPASHAECICEYKVTLCGPLYCATNVTKETMIQYTKLEPCASYNVTVVMMFKNNQTGNSKTENFVMSEDIPSAVQIESVRYYPKELTINWKAPNFASICVSHYKVMGFSSKEPTNENFKFEEFANRTTIHIKNLISCTTYTIQIIPVTKGQQKGKIREIEAETNSTSSDPPSNPEAKSVTSHSIEITTKDIDQTNQCQILYARFTCETEEEGKIKYAELTVPGYLGEFTGVLQPLSPLTKYNCRAYVFNIGGWSTSSLAILETGKYYPDVPDDISATAISNTSIDIKWKQPRFLNGNYVIYKVYIQSVGPKYKMPPHCAPIQLQNFTQTVESQLGYVFKDALPYVQYNVQIAAKNDYGTGSYSLPVAVTTDPWIPEPVENFTVKDVEGPEVDLSYNASVTLSWQLPCQANGEITGFEGNFIGTRHNYEPHEFSWIIHVNDPFIEDKQSFEWRETRLRPEYSYVVSIVVQIKGVRERSEVKRVNFTSPAGIPPQVNITGRGAVSAFAARNPTCSAVISFSPDILQSYMGGVLYVAILLSERGCQCDPTLKYDKIDSIHEWPPLKSWYDVQSQECVSQYQTTPLRWDPLKDRSFARAVNPNHPVEFVIGNDDCSRKHMYCNGPLKPDTKYAIALRLFTKSGFSDVALMNFKTDAVVQIYFILLLIVSCLLFAFMLGFVYLWFTKRIKWHRNSINGIDEQSGDISAKNFFMHYEELTKRDKLQREFKELTVVANDLSLSNIASKSNESKNRYSNIFPYDKNRVILGCDADGSDYINASFINGYKHKKEYIATQGPKPESYVDFWKMILQYNVRIIVMLTQMKERDIVKCHPYFPTLSKEMTFGHNIEVRCTKEIAQDLYDKREFVVEHTGDGIIQKVVHYYFKKWPDHDCPTDPNDVILFVRKIKSEKIPSHTPIVIHCSAGVGRTGTFIGLDIIMQRLKCEGKINIFETVKELRFQRMQMVQTIPQYQFLYSCAYELVKRKFPSKKKNKPSTSENEVRLSNSRDSSKRLSFCPNDIESTM